MAEKIKPLPFSFSLTATAVAVIVIAVILSAPSFGAVVEGHDFDNVEADKDQGVVSFYSYTFNFAFDGTDAQSVLWYFGFDNEDGTPATSTEFNPRNVKFPSKGTYTVWQVASNTVGDYYTKMTVNVFGTPEVTFDSNGGSVVEQQIVTAGERVSEPQIPIKDGYTFDGWYSDEELTVRYDFEIPVNSHITLYAKWTESSGTPGSSDDGDNKNQQSSNTTDSSKDVNGLMVAFSVTLIIIGSAGAIINRNGDRRLVIASAIMIAIGLIVLITGTDIQAIGGIK